ncbi:MAG: HupE/UreJ family protein [Gammaproteobacteria bacterium]|nr:HupE/UreJ family protein [Gammaproteobacteria bacterium]
MRATASRRPPGGMGFGVLLLAWLLGASGVVLAHRVQPALVTLSMAADGSYTLSVRLDLEAMLAGISSEHEDTRKLPQAAQYERLRALSADALRERLLASAERFTEALDVRVDDHASQPRLVAVDVPQVTDAAGPRSSVIELQGVSPLPASSRASLVRFGYPAELGQAALRVLYQGLPIGTTVWLAAGATSPPIHLSAAGGANPALAAPDPGQESVLASALQTVARYLRLGFVHILPGGLDHILFVLGMFLLSRRLRPLLYQVTAFTVAHSITLALASLGYVALPGSVVEPLIAASIVYVAVENIVSPELRPWRLYVVFAFGLLHGLGFADVLGTLGLPPGELLLALIGFNIGVELGQIAVLAIATAVVLMLPWGASSNAYRRAVVLPGSATISLCGAWWLFSRLAG